MGKEFNDPTKPVTPLLMPLPHFAQLKNGLLFEISSEYFQLGEI